MIESRSSFPGGDQRQYAGQKAENKGRISKWRPDGGREMCREPVSAEKFGLRVHGAKD